jgi:adenylate cyclase
MTMNLPLKATSAAPPRVALPWDFTAAQIVNRVRLITGLILFVYILTHFSNHLVGLVSLDAMQAWHGDFMSPWWSKPGTYTLLGAVTIHVGLAYWAIFRRRSLRLKRWEAAQLLTGALIPYMLIEHVVSTRVAFELYDLQDSYTYVLWSLFGTEKQLFQAATLVFAWLHGCIGLHYWLRLKPWFAKARPWLFAFAILMPVLVLISFFQTGREVMVMMRDPVWQAQTIANMKLPKPEDAAHLLDLRDGLRFALLAGLGLVFAARFVRGHLEGRRGRVRVQYHGGRKVAVPRGRTLLEISRMNNIPHASVCGGRGRCSTCRVRIGQGGESLPPPDANEARVLARISAPPTVRLACQIRPQQDMEITPLLPAHALPQDGFARPEHTHGMEMEIAVLFADLRGFTSLSEQKLPFDIVFILNRYFAEMGEAIGAAGGTVTQFSGDGVMALFGYEREDPPYAARSALRAARRMAERLEALNADFAHDLDAPLRMGIGIHQGLAIVGEMGHGLAFGLTAIGDTVNTASRLEGLSKDFKAQLVVSDIVLERAGIRLEGAAEHSIVPRGRTTPMTLFALPHAVDLPDLR